MKPYFLVTFLFLLPLWIGCKKDDDQSIPKGLDFTVSYEETQLEAPIECSREWAITGVPEWVELSTDRGSTSQRITVKVKGNPEHKKREAKMLITSGGHQSEFRLSQEALPETGEYVYKLPVVFHVLHYSSAQNIPKEILYKVLAETNRLLRNGENGSSDLGVELALAERDPLGHRLAEEGINRVYWAEERIDAPSFINEQGLDHLNLVWDPNKYVNVVLSFFDVQEILGISTFPLLNPEVAGPPAALNMPEGVPFHLDNAIRSELKIEDLKKLRCILINSEHYQDTPKSIAYNAATLAHELGHYLGLRHVFNEGGNGVVPCQDTDSCQDTPSYDKQAYEAWIQHLSTLLEDKEFAKTFDINQIYMRESCDGEKFVSRNLMDYDYCKKDYFSPQQKAIVRHILYYSPFMPGPKKPVSTPKLKAAVPSGQQNPFSYVVCRGSRAAALDRELVKIK